MRFFETQVFEVESKRQTDIFKVLKPIGYMSMIKI